MELPQDAYQIVYAADIGALNVVDVQRRLDQVMRMVTSWMGEHNSSEATERTEIV